MGAITDKVADRPFRRSDPEPGKDGGLTDQDGDGRLAHRDLYLRDFERIPRFHPQRNAPVVEPSAAVQPATIPLLDNPAHPGHALYAEALQGMQASPYFSGEQNQQQLAANLVAAIATLPEGRVGDGLLQERLLAAQPERGQPREPIRRGRWSDKEPDWVMEGDRLLQSCSVKQFDCNLD